MFSHNSCYTRQIYVAIIVLLFGSSFKSNAQPQLKFDSVIVAFPQITLQFKIGCSIVPKKNNYKIKEDGKDITNFTLVYADTTRQHCCISTAIIIDRSGSMGWGSPSGLDGAKQGAKAFVNAMDGACDEATLISFNELVKVDVFMTHDKALLANGIDGLSAINGTAVWDAAIVGINELANNGTQPCRGIILLTDGEDNASANSVQDVISLALSKGIPVYTIGLGTGINVTDLQHIASSTGGTYTQTNDPNLLKTIFLNLYDKISNAGFSGQIIYNTTTKCLDGSTRTIDLTLDGAVGCPGTITQTKKFKVPLDSSTFTLAEFKIGTVIAKPGDIVNLPLSLETDINDLLERAQFTIEFADPSCANWFSIFTSGFLLNGVGIDATPVLGGYTFGTMKTVGPVHQGILALLKFQVQPGPDRECPIILKSWIFSKGCIKPILISGKIIVKNYSLSVIAPNGGENLCRGTTQRITWVSKNMNKIHIYLSNDGGITYPTIIANAIDASTGYWDWYIDPNLPIGKQYRIQIRDESTGAILSASTSNFNIGTTPLFNSQLSDKTACIGDSVSFTVSIIGIQTPNIQWQTKSPVAIDFSDIVGERDSTLTLRNIAYSQNNSLYRAHIINSCANVYTDSAKLTLSPIPTILSQPQSQDVCYGSSATFSVAVSGANILYQWRKDGIPINYATQSSYTISSVSQSDLGNYDVNIFGTCSASSIASAVAQLRSTPLPQITSQPHGDTVCVGKSVTFSVSARGKGLHYQWRKSGVPISGAVSSTFTMLSVLNSDNGFYDVAITDSCGLQYVSSNPALLIVNINPIITNQPANQILCEGSTATFTFTGTSATSQQWLKNGKIIPGATSNSLTISNIQIADTGSYSVRLLNNCGQTISTQAYLSVMKTTAITTQPVSQVANQNNSVTFSVYCVGSNLTYQWKKNGIDIPGATSASFTISSAKKSDEGNYSVVVIGQCGPAVQSNIATLSVTLVDVKQTSSPSLFYLGQNYPNPFTQTTTIKLPLLVGEGRVEDSQWRGEVFFKIYDIFGREVLDLSKQVIGNLSLVISNSQLPSQGIYFYRLTIGNQSQTKMMMLIK